MYEYIEGPVIIKNPACCVIDIAGIGYCIQISLNTYSKIQSLSRVKLFIHQAIREDAHILYGFFTEQEREIFRLLISVSGIGANTARMMLSSLSPVDLQKAIYEGNATLLQNIKGIGAKTAQRVIIDLRDKISKEKLPDDIFPFKDNRLKEEALSALTLLGFNKGQVEKVIGRIITSEPNILLEELIKKALKLL